MRHIQYFILFALFLFIVFIYLYNGLDRPYFYTTFAEQDHNGTNDYNKTNSNKLNKFTEIKNQREILGIVKNGIFIESETKLSFKLTNIGLLDEIAPESGFLNLSKYEGKAIMISNQLIDTEWIWDAKITDIANSIVTQIVKKIYDFE